jgi:hypothetical protein
VNGDGRTVVIACGAALLNARLALHRLGYATRVTPLPDGADQDLLARIRIVGAREPTAAEVRLADAIPHEIMGGTSFEHEPVPDSLALMLVDAAAREGAWLVLLRDPASLTEARGLLAANAPSLAILGTEADDRAAWLSAGQALQRVVLEAAAAGLGCSLLNHPIQVPELHAAVQRLAGGEGGFPQVLLGLGRVSAR